MSWFYSLIERKEFWAILGTILGTLFGFALNESTRMFRDWREKRRLKTVLYDELETNLYQIEHKKDTIRRMLAALQNKEVLSGMSVPCATAIYDNHFASISKHLNGFERDNIQNIYSRLKLDNTFMNKFEQHFKSDVKGDVVADPWKTYQNKLSDILEDFEIAQELIKALLDKKPIDIYYRKDKTPTTDKTFVGKATPKTVREEKRG